MSQASATRTVQISEPEDMHLRSATTLAQMARRFRAKTEVRRQGQPSVPATEALQVAALLFGCSKGEQLQLSASGDDAEEALDALAELFANRFGEGTQTQESQGG